jgi:multiple sugar transport system substrate-binding protein
MKKMFKRSVPALALSAVAFMALSCGGSTVDGYVPYGSDDVSKIEADIVWWNNYQVPTLSDELTEEQARAKSTYREYYYAKDLIDAFEAIYPNITVTQEYKGSYSEIQTAVNTALTSGDTPDIATCYGDHVAGYKKAGASYALDGYMDDENIGYGKGVDNDGKAIDDASTAKSDVNQNYLDAEKSMYAENAFYSLPYSKSSETLAVNQDVFDLVGAGTAGTTTDTYTAPVAVSSKTKYTIPTTWGELISTARKMKEDFPNTFTTQKDDDGYFIAVPFCWDSGENMFISLMQNLGIPYTSNTSSNVADQILFKNDDAKKVVTQLKKWNNEGLIATQNQLYLSDPTKGYHQYSSTMVTNGTVFMAVSSTAGARYFATDGGFKASFNKTVQADKDSFGLGTGSNDLKVISQGPSLTFFKKSDTDRQYASWLFYKYLTNTDNSAKLAVNTAYFPLRTSSYQTESVQNLLSAADTGVDSSASYSAKSSAYTGAVLELNEQYTASDSYFLSPVFDLSSAARTAVGNLLNTVLSDTTATSDEDIATLVNSAFDTAYSAVLA